MSLFYQKKYKLSRDFLKKNNNRHLSIKSTDFVNMGGVVVPPIYTEKTRANIKKSPANAPDRASQPYAQSFALTCHAKTATKKTT